MFVIPIVFGLILVGCGESANPDSDTSSSSKYTCNCSKTCEQMVSCEEALYQLNDCGCAKRDGDDDGVPCESICPGG